MIVTFQFFWSFLMIACESHVTLHAMFISCPPNMYMYNQDYFAGNPLLHIVCHVLADAIKTAWQSELVNERYLERSRLQVEVLPAVLGGWNASLRFLGSHLDCGEVGETCGSGGDSTSSTVKDHKNDTDLQHKSR